VCPGPTLTAADGGDGAIGVGTASAHAGKTQRRIVSAWIGTAYAQEDAAAAHAQWRMVADQIRPKVPKLAP
jgi:putative transposase